VGPAAAFLYVYRCALGSFAFKNAATFRALSDPDTCPSFLLCVKKVVDFDHNGLRLLADAKGHVSGLSLRLLGGLSLPF